LETSILKKEDYLRSVKKVQTRGSNMLFVTTSDLEGTGSPEELSEKGLKDLPSKEFDLISSNRQF
jgi:hypothetical protein